MAATQEKAPRRARSRLRQEATDAPKGGTFRVIQGKINLPEIGTLTREDGWFDSELPLDSMFANKVERMGGDPEEFQNYLRTWDKHDTVDDPTEHAKRLARKVAGVMPDDPESLEATIAELQEKLRVAKEFQETGDGPSAQLNRQDAGKDTKSRKAPSRATRPAKDDEDETEPDYGEDVSENFSSAEEKQLQVFKSGKNYTIVKDGEKLNEDDITRKGDVEEFISNL